MLCEQVAWRTNSGYGGLLEQHCLSLGLLWAPDVGVLEEDTSYQTQAGRVRAREGWVAGSDIWRAAETVLGGLQGGGCYCGWVLWG